MAPNLVLEHLLECKSELEVLRQSTKIFCESIDEFWWFGVDTRLEKHVIEITKLIDIVKPLDDQPLHQNDLGQRAINVCDQVKQAADWCNEQGLQKLGTNPTKEAWSSIKEKHLVPALNSILQLLNLLSQIILIIEQEPNNRHTRRAIQSVSTKSFQKAYEARIRGISREVRKVSFSIDRSRGIQFGDPEISWFWKTILCPRGLSAKRRGRADGILIGHSYVDKAYGRLKEFQNAWLNVNNSRELRPIDAGGPLEDLTKMPKIVCVLKGCNQQSHLNTLLRVGITDDCLTDYDLLDRMKNAMRGQEDDAELIFAEIARVRQRAWNRHTELSLYEHEPLPLLQGRELRRSSPHQTGVYEVTDAWDEQYKYAHKIIERNNYDVERRKHLDNEIKKLIHIGKEQHGHHIVQCVKSYTRGRNEIGMLLLPVANTDLESLLKLCCNDLNLRRQKRAAILKACGCLAYAMCYLHNVVDIRHYDVKPSNILVCFEPHSDELRFLWADFGLAFGFQKDAGRTGSPNPNYAPTPGYAPPDKEIHSRAHDVFAFGCVLLEMVCVLSMGTSVNLGNLSIHQYFNYRDNLTELLEWIEKTSVKLQESDDKSLRKILEIAKDMVLTERTKRPRIHQVLERLRKIDIGDSRNGAPLCSSCVVNISKDLSRHPVHPGIFEHKSSSPQAKSSTFKQWLNKVNLKG